MKKTRRFLTVSSKVLSSALALFVFTQCTDDPKLETPDAAPQAQTEVVSEEEAPVLSLTIDGIHTVLASMEDCKTCNYVVPEDATVVDGKELGIKPGQAICLNESFKYGNLRLINLEGSESKPIMIAYNVKNAEAVANN